MRKAESSLKRPTFVEVWCSEGWASQGGVQCRRARKRRMRKKGVIVRTLDEWENKESLSATFVEGEKETEKFSWWDVGSHCAASLKKPIMKFHIAFQHFLR